MVFKNHWQPIILWAPSIGLKTNNDNTRIDGNDYGNYLVEADQIKKT